MIHIFEALKKKKNHPTDNKKTLSYKLKNNNKKE